MASIEKIQNAPISDAVLNWFEQRGIDCETVSYAGIYSAKTFLGYQFVTFPCFDEKGEVANNRGGTLEGDQLVDLERMDGGKDMFYNMQALDLAAKENKPLVVCQREMDVLSFLQAGYPWAIGYIEGDELLWDYLGKFKGVKKVILAGYNNDAGKAFNELVSKKLGLGRCGYIEFPDDCITANDVLVKQEKGALNQLLRCAKNYPVVGLYKPNEFPPLPEEFKTPYKTGMGREHDFHIKVMLGKLMIVTGVPGHGKSEWADTLCLNLAKNYRFPICVCSSEIDNEEYEENTIRRYLRRPLQNCGVQEPIKAKQFYQNHYTFITNTTMDDELELTLEKLIELAEVAIIRDGCKVVMLDPWNEIEHCRKSNETETEYTGRAIRMLKRMAKVYKVLVIVVAHPKMPEQGKLKCPTMYSISGSANWFNKADYGIILWREDPTGDLSEVRIAKIKRQGPMGKLGRICVKLDEHTRNFKELE